MSVAHKITAKNPWERERELREDKLWKGQWFWWYEAWNMYFIITAHLQESEHEAWCSPSQTPQIRPFWLSRLCWHIWYMTGPSTSSMVVGFYSRYCDEFPCSLFSLFTRACKNLKLGNLMGEIRKLYLIWIYLYIFFYVNDIS